MFRRRPEVRQEEAATHVTLLVESLGEVRVVSCLRTEWESEQPDLRALLARAVARGRLPRNLGRRRARRRVLGGALRAVARELGGCGGPERQIEGQEERLGEGKEEEGHH